MARFQLLSCNVALAGDLLNVVARHPYNPITYPELLALQHIHGPNAVTEIYECGAQDRDEGQEFQRLMETYGAATVRERLFPGAGTRLPTGDERYTIRPRRTGDVAPPIPDLPTAPGTDGQPLELEDAPDTLNDAAANAPNAYEQGITPTHIPGQTVRTARRSTTTHVTLTRPTG